MRWSTLKTGDWNQVRSKLRKPCMDRNPREVENTEKELVDVTGIEPATSCLQSTRSPS